MWMFSTTIPTWEGITLRVKFSDRPRLRVRADGSGLVGHAGSRLLAELAERSGLSQGLSKTLAPLVKRRRRHDPGRVLVDLAVTLADGGECIADLATLRQQPDLFGEVASTPTAWRVLASIEEPLLERLELAPGPAPGPGPSTGPGLVLGAGSRAGDPGLRRHPGGGGVREQRAGRSHLEARLRLPPFAGLSGPDRGGFGGPTAARECRCQHSEGPPGAAGQGAGPAAPADQGRRS